MGRGEGVHSAERQKYQGWSFEDIWPKMSEFIFGPIIVTQRPTPGGTLRSGTDVERPHSVCTLTFIISLLEAPSGVTFVPSGKMPPHVCTLTTIISLLEAPSGVQPSYVQGAEGAPGDGIEVLNVTVA
jgi:hypothetical protein